MSVGAGAGTSLVVGAGRLLRAEAGTSSRGAGGAAEIDVTNGDMVEDTMVVGNGDSVSDNVNDTTMDNADTVNPIATPPIRYSRQTRPHKDKLLLLDETCFRTIIKGNARRPVAV